MLRRMLVPALFLALASAAPGGEKMRPTPQQLWADLGAAEEIKVARAILHLAGRGEETVAFLKNHVKPVKEDSERVAQHIRDLASDKFPVREAASAELEYLGKYVRPTLEKALAEKPGLETAKRIKTLLDKIPNPAAKPKLPPPLPMPGKPISVSSINGKVIINGIPLERYLQPPTAVDYNRVPASWTRMVRVIAVLEHVGTRPARELLDRLAAGEPDALPTIEARAAIERLKGEADK